MQHLLANMKTLCDTTRMLTGLTIAYGTPRESEQLTWGRAQEMILSGDQFVPEVRLLNEDSIYDLASLSKLFTAVMTIILVEKGLLSLDEYVGEIDPRFTQLKNVSVFDTLSFRAGLKTPGRIDAAPDREEALRRLFAVTCGEPERIRIYSDINAMVIKYVIEQKTDLPFAQALQQYIFAPIGLHHTYASVPSALANRCVCYNYEHRIAGEDYILRTEPAPGHVHDPKAARLSLDGRDLCGHAGLFSTRDDMIRFAQALLSGELLTAASLRAIGQNRTGFPYGDGTHRQYLGFLCFTKHPNQHLSEVPAWMCEGSIGLSGFTGNHLSLDLDKQCFVLFLGNRCHGRISNIQPPPGGSLQDYGLHEDGTGCVKWTDGRLVPSSARYVYFKDALLHAPIEERMKQLGWL